MGFTDGALQPYRIHSQNWTLYVGLVGQKKRPFDMQSLNVILQYIPDGIGNMGQGMPHWILDTEEFGSNLIHLLFYSILFWFFFCSFSSPFVFLLLIDYDVSSGLATYLESPINKRPLGLQFKSSFDITVSVIQFKSSHQISLYVIVFSHTGPAYSFFLMSFFKICPFSTHFNGLQKMYFRLLN